MVSMQFSRFLHEKCHEETSREAAQAFQFNRAFSITVDRLCLVANSGLTVETRSSRAQTARNCSILDQMLESECPPLSSQQRACRELLDSGWASTREVPSSHSAPIRFLPRR